MSGDTRVFCKDCKHRRCWERLGTGPRSPVFVASGNDCEAEPTLVPHPIFGDMKVYAKCEQRNAAFNCALFEAGEPWSPYDEEGAAPKVELTQAPEPEQRKRWWRFWQ